MGLGPSWREFERTVLRGLDMDGMLDEVVSKDGMRAGGSFKSVVDGKHPPPVLVGIGVLTFQYFRRTMG